MSDADLAVLLAADLTLMGESALPRPPLVPREARETERPPKIQQGVTDHE